MKLKVLKELILKPRNIGPALDANYKAWVSKQYTKHTEGKTKYDFIKTTAEILQDCPNNCCYELECCGCSIYAAAEKNKKCKYSNKN
jgi:hypothetical protein